MTRKMIAVCNDCDENIDLTEAEPFSDTCKYCGGKVSDAQGKVMIVEYWERERRDENDGEGSGESE